MYADSHANTTINFADGLQGTIKLTGGELAITQSTIIDGPGAQRLAVSGTSRSRIFAISPDTTVTISGLTISDGLADSNAFDGKCFGGGILNQGDLTLKDTVLSHNKAVGDKNVTISLKVTKAVLTGCAAGGGVANFHTLTVSHSRFVGNEARAASGCVSTGPTGIAGDAGGGAIASFGFTPEGGNGHATLNVTFSHFSNNQAIAGDQNQSTRLPGHAFGGAVASHRFNGSTALTVSDCTFEQNKSIGGKANEPGSAEGANSAAAGGVSAIGTGTINDSTFDQNEAIGGQGAKSSNGGDAGGGGIGVAFLNTVVTVRHCTVKHNRAVGGQAGAGDHEGSNIYSQGTLVVDPKTVIS